MTTHIVFDVLPLVTAGGSLIPAGKPTRETIPGATPWEAIESRWISNGGEYSARRTVQGYDPPYAIVQMPSGWVALYSKGSVTERESK